MSTNGFRRSSGIKNYKDLIVWQKSRELVYHIYLLTQKLPDNELYSLINQIRRAAISIPSNIAEGYSRGADKEFIYFLRIAKGSAAELETQLILCQDLNYLSKEETKKAMRLNDEVIRMLGTLILKIGKDNREE